MEGNAFCLGETWSVNSKWYWKMGLCAFAEALYPKLKNATFSWEYSKRSNSFQKN